MKYAGRIGIAITAVSLIAYVTGPQPGQSATKPPLQNAFGGADALATALGGLVLWYLVR